MARIVPAEMKAQILSGVTYPVALVYLDWPGGEVRVHSGVGDLSWDSETWTGVGGHGFIRIPPVASGIGQTAGEISFGGLTDIVDAMLDDDSEGVAVEVWFGCLAGRSPAALVGDPVRVFVGTVDDAGDTIDGASHKGVLSIISGPSQMSRGSPVHTYEDQQMIDPTDTAGRWVRAALSEAIATPPKW